MHVLKEVVIHMHLNQGSAASQTPGSGHGRQNAAAGPRLQKRRRSNLEGMRRAIMPYFSMKCSAMSPMALPAATTCRARRVPQRQPLAL